MYLPVVVMSRLRMTKAALSFYFRTLAHISISALCAPLSHSVVFAICVRMSDDTFDIHSKLRCKKSPGLILFVFDRDVSVQCFCLFDKYCNSFLLYPEFPCLH